MDGGTVEQVIVSTLPVTITTVANEEDEGVSVAAAVEAVEESEITKREGGDEIT